MKRGILVATFLVTAAGVASAASLLTGPSHGAASARVEAATPVQTAPVAAAPFQTAAVVPVAPVARSVPAPAPVVQKASVETRQAPVPLLVKPRPPVNLPATEAAKADGKAPEAATTTDTAAGDAFNEKAAKAAIEADGYKGVTVLRKGVNGIWHAKALRGRTEVMVTVDARGSVSTD